MTRGALSTGFAFCASGAVIGGLWLTWRSCAFWHGGGALWTAVATGAFVVAAAYLRSWHALVALCAGIAAGLVAGVGVAVVALAHCAS
jgi:hypothetical protein